MQNTSNATPFLKTPVGQPVGACLIDVGVGNGREINVQLYEVSHSVPGLTVLYDMGNGADDAYWPHEEGDPSLRLIALTPAQAEAARRGPWNATASDFLARMPEADREGLAAPIVAAHADLLREDLLHIANRAAEVEAA